jgi:hypothetical protein
VVWQDRNDHSHGSGPFGGGLDSAVAYVNPAPLGRGRESSRDVHMRTSHWWGATLGAGVVASAAFLAPSALAAGPALSKPLPPKVTKTVPSKSIHARDNGRGGREDHSDHGCHYPPHGTPDVAITGSKAWHRTVNVNGSAKLNTCGYGHKKAVLYQLHKGHGWEQVAETTTSDAGDFSFSFHPQGNGRDKILVRAAVAGGHGIDAGQSDVLKIENSDHPF